MPPAANQGFLDWTQLGPVTGILAHELHYAALAFMVVAYAIKIRQLLKLPAIAEGTPPRGDNAKAVRYAYMTLAMPWELESQRRHWWRYIEFALFHIAIAFGIGTAFILPMAHEAMRTPLVVYGLQAIFALAAGIGISRLANRLLRPEMRAISSLDDYFCLVTLTLWMAAGIVAVPQKSDAGLLAFYVLATFFLIYVPFSKISHYVYWPFIRYYMGKHFGHRAVYPKKAVPKLDSVG
jgi:nitrate reductase gamma subunit